MMPSHGLIWESKTPLVKMQKTVNGNPCLQRFGKARKKDAIKTKATLRGKSCKLMTLTSKIWKRKPLTKIFAGWFGAMTLSSKQNLMNNGSAVFVEENRSEMLHELTP
jgi:hypothetical protein